MAEEITNGALTWEARIDTSKLSEDAKTLSELFNKIGNFELDTTSMDTILKDQAAKEVELRNGVAQQVKQINAEIVTDTKSKAEEMQKFTEALTKELPTQEQSPKLDINTDAIIKAKEAYAEATPEQRKFIDDLIEMQQHLTTLNQEQNKLREAVSGGAITWQEYYAAFNKNVAEIALAQEKFKNLTVPVPGAQNLPDNFSEVISKAKEVYEQADAVTKKYYDDLTRLELQLNSLKAEQSSLNAAFNNGNVSQEKYLEQTSQLKSAVDSVSSSISGVKEAQAAYLDSLNEEGETTEKNITLLTEYRKLKNQIAADALNGVVNQEDIDRAAELEETLKGVNTQIKLEGSNSAFLSAATEGVRGLVGAFEALSGVMGLVNADNEEAEKIMQKTIGFMGVLQGLEEVSQILESNGKLNTYIKTLLGKSAAVKANTVAQSENNVATAAGTVAQEVNAAASIADAGAKGAEATATEGATAAQWSLNAAMEANPAGIILLVVTALIAAYEIFANSTENQIEKQTELNEKLLETKKLFDDLTEVASQPYNERITDAEQQLAIAQAAGKSTAEIAKLQKAVIDAKKDLNSFEAGSSGVVGTLKEQQDQVTQLAYKYEQLRYELNNTSDEDRKKLLQVQTESAKHDYEQAKKVVEDRISLENEGKVTQIANQKKFNDLALASDADYWQAKVLLAQKGSKEWLDAQLKVNQAAYNKAVSQPDANLAKAAADKIIADRQAKNTFSQQAIKNTENDINAQLTLVAKGSETELELRLKLIDEESKAAIISAQNNASEIERINAESEKKKNDLKLQFAQNNADKLLQLQEDNLKVMLADAVQGSEDYLNYTIGLNSLSAQKSVTDAIAAAAKNNPAITTNDIAQSSTFDEKQATDFANKIESIDANLAQRIRAIWAETNSKNQQDTNKFIEGQIDSANKLFDIQAKVAKDYNNQIISNQDSSALEKVNAQIRNNKIDTQAAQNQLTSLTTQLSKSYGEAGTAIQQYIQSVQGDFSKISELSDKDSDISHVFDGIKDPKAKEMLEQVLTLLHELGIETDKLHKDKFKAYAEGITRIGDSISALGQDLAQYNSKLGNTISGIGNFVVQMTGAVKAIKQMSDEGKKLSFDSYVAAAQSAVQLIGMVINAAAQRRAKEREYMAASIAQQREYNLALNDAILLNTKLKDNVFVTNYSGQIVDAWESISDATSHYNDALKDVENLQVKIGTAKKVDGNAVLKGVGSGAVLGAAVGSIVPVIGNAVGAVVGGVIGGIVGLFSKKRVDVYGNLFDKYPELFDKTKKGVDAFNDSLAQSLIDSNKVKDSSKEVLQSLIDWKKQVEEARQQMAEVVQTLAGNLGDTIANSLTDAFEQGTDAGKAFADSVKQTLENVIKQQLLNQVFGKAFDELQKRMEASFDPTTGGDMNWTDDLTNFFNQYGTLASQFEQGLQDAKDAAATAGLDIFQSTDSVKQGLAGAIQASITEDTANELAGLWRGQYDVTKQTMQIAKDALVYHQRIEANTAQSLLLFSAHLPSLTRFLPYLKDIYDNTTPAQIKRDLGL
ncbi:MAG: hypothetical protein ACTHLB_05470 [Parafilimonas sp.]